jgi:aminoglycoside phosphotransferase (APT) family kinase protein
MAAREHAPAQALTNDIAELLRRHGLCAEGEAPHAEALAGGVSSDIWRVELASGPICVKRALPRLRVSQLWEAPVARNRYEYEWFRVAREAAPQAVPRVLFRDDDAFAMEYLDPAAHPVWKSRLREGHAEPAFAARVGRTLAAIHAATAGREDLARRFPTDAIFHAIRLEPYLAATGRAHPDLAQRLDFLLRKTADTKACLVHGDVSPKNILCGPHGPVFLDAECAWYGDPAFDLAFCLNHLLLKCLWVPRARTALLECFDQLSESYLANVRFEDVESRTAALLPALLLARVDGKSPVEYLTAASDKETVRRAARPLIAHPVQRLAQVRTAWQESST